MSLLRCPSCGEIVSDGREYCANCGAHVPDDAAPVERRVRALLIIALVLGAAFILSSLVREWLASR